MCVCVASYLSLVRGFLQGLNITQQLDSGIRFIDFRIMYTAGPNTSESLHGVIPNRSALTALPRADYTDYDWYCMHFGETNHKAVTYLEAIRDWLQAHPTEIVMIWFSKHGQ